MTWIAALQASEAQILGLTVEINSINLAKKKKIKLYKPSTCLHQLSCTVAVYYGVKKTKE